MKLQRFTFSRYTAKREKESGKERMELYFKGLSHF